MSEPVVYTGSEMCEVEALVEANETFLHSDNILRVLSDLLPIEKLPADRQESFKQALGKLHQESADNLHLLASGQFTWICHAAGTPETALYRIIPGKPVHLPGYGPGGAS
jgi:hypothetical protein